MLTKKRIVTALACAAALGVSGAALATPVNVDGVTWDTDSQFNLQFQSLNLRETSISQVGDVLTGYGQIGSINSNNNFCQNCDLTFTFTYKVKAIDGLQVVFDSGSFQFYVGAAGSYDAGNPSSATTGTPWVTLSGHDSANPAFLTQGQLYSTVVGTAANPQNGSNGYGLVDATGGDAAPYLNIYQISDGMGGFANLTLNSSFLFQPANGCGTTPSTNLDNICAYPIEGNGSLIGKPLAVPEPGEVGLLGLGVGLLGFFMWRRRKETDGRE